MTKFLSALTLLAFAFGAQAASHAGGAPMKADAGASAAAPAASAAKKADKKAEKAAAKKDDTMKKDEAMKK